MTPERRAELEAAGFRPAALAECQPAPRNQTERPVGFKPYRPADRPVSRPLNPVLVALRAQVRAERITPVRLKDPRPQAMGPVDQPKERPPRKPAVIIPRTLCESPGCNQMVDVGQTMCDAHQVAPRCQYTGCLRTAAPMGNGFGVFCEPHRQWKNANARASRARLAGRLPEAVPPPPIDGIKPRAGRRPVQGPRQPRPMGRPQLPPESLREKVLTFRLTAAEKQAMIRAARLQGRRPSDWMREALIAASRQIEEPRCGVAGCQHPVAVISGPDGPQVDAFCYQHTPIPTP